MPDHCPPWPITPGCLPDSWDPDNLNPDQLAAIQRASDWLSAASGGVWGPCVISRRFCPPEGYDRCAPGPCSCGTACALELSWPAFGPVSFLVDGAYQPVRWEIVDYATLYRLDGRCWPACADLLVTYTRGWPVHAGDPASVAMTRLAVWIYEQDCPAAECGDPPPDWTSLTRDGWQVQRDTDQATGVFGALTGIASVDAWIRSARIVPGVIAYSPDAGWSGGVAITDSGR